MKVYEVLIRASTTVVVQAENEDDAVEIAHEVAPSLYGLELDHISVDQELKSPDDVDAAIRHSAAHRYDGRKMPYADEE